MLRGQCAAMRPIGSPSVPGSRNGFFSNKPQVRIYGALSTLGSSTMGPLEGRFNVDEDQHQFGSPTRRSAVVGLGRNIGDAAIALS
jgi:hypothetical protein